MFLTTTYTVEDCQYYNTSETEMSGTSKSVLYNSNLSEDLPNACEVSFDAHSSFSGSGEHRFFLLPKSQYGNGGTTQPSYALYYDILTNSVGKMGKRENSSTIAVSSNFDCSVNTYHTIKYVIDGTTVKGYVDDVLKYTETMSWIGNYTDYAVSMMHWSASGTSKIKNVKIKPL